MGAAAKFISGASKLNLESFISPHCNTNISFCQVPGLIDLFPYSVLIHSMSQFCVEIIV